MSGNFKKNDPEIDKKSSKSKSDEFKNRLPNNTFLEFFFSLLLIFFSY